MRRDDDDRRRPAFCNVFWSVISLVSPLAGGGLVGGCSGDLGVTTVAAGAGEGWWEFFRIPGLSVRRRHAGGLSSFWSVMQGRSFY